MAIALAVAARFFGLATLPAGAAFNSRADSAGLVATPSYPSPRSPLSKSAASQPAPDEARVVDDGASPGAASAPVPRPVAPLPEPQRAPSPAPARPEMPAAGGGPAIRTVALAPGKVVLGYWARWGDEPHPQRSLERALDVVDYVTPYWFTLRGDGSLAARERDHGALLEQVRRQGRQVLILVNNGRGSRAAMVDPALRAVAVENLYRVVRDYGAAGVQIDFEGLPADLRDPLSAFVGEVAARLRPEGYLTTVAVGPKRSAESLDNDGAQAYDYEALGRIADLVVLMTYDQHGEFSGPGPVAGLPWVEDVVRYAVTAIPPGKILLGVAGYGYDWSPSGVAVVPARTAAALAADRGAAITLDGWHIQPYFDYVDAGGQRHQVWYESAESASLKFGLVNRYGLGGVAVWSLGQESPKLWPLLRGQITE